MSVRDEADERNARTTIRPEINGPYIVRNLHKITNSKGETLHVRPIIALCRCGGSKSKPYCDGTHSQIGFDSSKDPARRPDRFDKYEGKEIIVLDNRGTCCHFGNCTDHLPTSFTKRATLSSRPTAIRPSGSSTSYAPCPSGALGYIRDGMVYAGETRDPEIYVAENASYYVRGSIELEGEPMNQGANREHYALCRCGQSKTSRFATAPTGGSSFTTRTISVY